MELKELYEKITTAKELSTVDVSLIDKRIRAGMEGKIRAAQSELPKLEQEYKNKVVSDCVIIAVKGKFCKEFADMSRSFKTLPLDFLSAVDHIGDSILKRGGKNQYTSHEHLMVMDELNKIKLNYKVSQLPVFQAKFDGVGPNTDLKTALYKQLTSQYGGQLYSVVVRGDIGTLALEMGFSGKVLPVVLYNYTVDSDSSMLPSPVELIEVNKKTSKEFVKDTLMKVRENLNNRQKSN